MDYIYLIIFCIISIFLFYLYIRPRYEPLRLIIKTNKVLVSDIKSPNLVYLQSNLPLIDIDDAIEFVNSQNRHERYKRLKTVFHYMIYFKKK